MGCSHAKEKTYIAAVKDELPPKYQNNPFSINAIPEERKKQLNKKVVEANDTGEQNSNHGGNDDESNGTTKPRRMRQQGVTAERMAEEVELEKIEVIEKSIDSRAIITSALRTNALFLNMTERQMNAIVDAMSRTKVPKGNYACKHGDVAESFYAIESGSFTVSVPVKSEDKVVMKIVRHLGSGAAFGEAFLYNVKRTASCQAEEDSILWGISRKKFRLVLRKLVKNEFKNMSAFLLDNLAWLEEVDRADLLEIIKALETIKVPKGETILSQGDSGDGFYIIRKGDVSISQNRNLDFRTSQRKNGFIARSFVR